jgi:AcrR family transcriptional regulator
VDRIEEPQNERSRRTRAAALDAAWELLEERGPEHVTMGEVATRAGITRRGLYLHFPSRSELLVALHTRIDERLDLDASVQPVFDAPDAVTALDEFVAHLARFHPKIRLIDAALQRAAEDDPDIAHLAQRGVAIWHDGCRAVAQRLADEGHLAAPWTVDTAADLMWTFMFPDPLGRLTVDRGWSNDRYRELLTVVFRRTLVTDTATP